MRFTRFRVRFCSRTSPRSYMKQHTVTLAPGGQKRDLSLITNHMIPAFGSMRLCDIGTEEDTEIPQREEPEGLSWWTRKALQAVMSSIFTKAEDWGYREGRNPARRTTLGRKKTKTGTANLDGRATPFVAGSRSRKREADGRDRRFNRNARLGDFGAEVAMCGSFAGNGQSRRTLLPRRYRRAEERTRKKGFALGMLTEDLPAAPACRRKS